MQTTSFELPIESFIPDLSAADTSLVCDEPTKPSSITEPRRNSMLPALLPALFGTVVTWGLLALNETARYFVLMYEIRPLQAWFRDNGATLLNLAAIVATVLAVGSIISEQRMRQTN